MNIRFRLLLIHTAVLLTTSAALADITDSATQQYPTTPSETLYRLYDDGAFNLVLFTEMEKHADSPAEKIAYLRQAMVLNPTDKSIRDKIVDLKQIVNSDTSPNKLNQKNTWLDTFSIKSFVPFYMIDYLLIVDLFIIIVLTFISKDTVLIRIILLIFSVYIIGDKLLVSYTRDGSLKIISSISDITKAEGIALREMKTYASQDVQSQVTAVIKPGSELDVLPYNPTPGSWVKVKFENGRSGWYLFDPKELFIIKR